MSLQVIGAGVGRTGTHSLKLALERLLGAPCYHMLEVFERPDDVEQWRQASRSEEVDWDNMFGGYAAAVDWPTAAYYDVLMEMYPDAIVLLSTRRNADEWWTSASSTIFAAIDRVSDFPAAMEQMIFEMLDARFTPDWREKGASMAAYLLHNDEVMMQVPSDRLVEWQPGDGWGPICEALGLPQPDEPFPHANSAAEFRAMTGLDPTPS
jgi:Sulfotransferase domain